MNILEGNDMFIINILGMLLLTLKLLGVLVGVGYFFIMCLVFWQITLIVLIISIIALVIFAIWVSSAALVLRDNVKKRKNVLNIK